MTGNNTADSWNAGLAAAKAYKRMWGVGPINLGGGTHGSKVRGDAETEAWESFQPTLERRGLNERDMASARQNFMHAYYQEMNKGTYQERNPESEVIASYTHPGTRQMWYVRRVPGDGGVDWEWTFNEREALPLSQYWARRFSAWARHMNYTPQLRAVNPCNPSTSDMEDLAFDAGKEWGLTGSWSSGVSNANVRRYGFVKWWNNTLTPATERQVRKSAVERAFYEGYKIGREKANQGFRERAKGRRNPGGGRFGSDESDLTGSVIEYEDPMTGDGRIMHSTVVHHGPSTVRTRSGETIRLRDIGRVWDKAAYVRIFGKVPEGPIAGRRNPSTGHRIKTTFSVVTPESAEHGDYAETGWIDQDGEDMDDAAEFYDADIIRTTVEWLEEKGVNEPSSSEFHPGVWYTATEYDHDYRTGADESRSYHLEGYTEDEQRRVFEGLFGRKGQRNPNFNASDYATPKYSIYMDENTYHGYAESAQEALSMVEGLLGRGFSPTVKVITREGPHPISIERLRERAKGRRNPYLLEGGYAVRRRYDDGSEDYYPRSGYTSKEEAEKQIQKWKDSPYHDPRVSMSVVKFDDYELEGGKWKERQSNPGELVLWGYNRTTGYWERLRASHDPDDMVIWQGRYVDGGRYEMSAVTDGRKPPLPPSKAEPLYREKMAKWMKSMRKYNLTEHNRQSNPESSDGTPDIYRTPVTIGGKRVTIFSSGVSSRQQANIVNRLFPDHSGDKQWHARKAQEFVDLKNRAVDNHSSLWESSFRETFGRAPEPYDFRISGIGSDKLPADVKDRLRDLSRVAGAASEIAGAHAAAAGVKYHHGGHYLAHSSLGSKRNPSYEVYNYKTGDPAGRTFDTLQEAQEWIALRRAESPSVRLFWKVRKLGSARNPESSAAPYEMTPDEYHEWRLSMGRADKAGNYDAHAAQVEAALEGRIGRLQPDGTRVAHVPERVLKFYPHLRRKYRASRCNPEPAAADLYESFHGKPSEELLEIGEEVHYHENLAGLGTLTEIKVDCFSGYSAELKFDRDTQLCSNEEGTQLYIVGGDQSLDLKALKFKDDEIDKDQVAIGVITEITYNTEKGFHNFKPTDYYHELGEESGYQPILTYDARSQLLTVAGGAYKIKPEGIVN